MDTSSRTSTALIKVLAALFVPMIVGIFLMNSSLNSAIARGQERVFDNAIPEAVPIKIKIKKNKEAAFKDSKNEKWLREFELELTNTSDKPIFFVYLNLVTDVKLGDGPLIFPLMYGRAELGDIITKARPEDVPIKPGETYVFKIHPGQIPAWERGVAAGNHPDALRIKASLQMLSFGDSTGYFVNKPYPKEQTTRSDAHSKLAERRRATSRGRPVDQQPTESKFPTFGMPTSFLSAVFFNGGLPRPSTSEENSEPNTNCGLFDYCVGITPTTPSYVCYNCPNQNRPGSDSAGFWRRVNVRLDSVFHRK